MQSVIELLPYAPITLGFAITSLLAWRSWRMDERSRAQGIEPQLEGFGGWLLLLAFGVIFAAWAKIRDACTDLIIHGIDIIIKIVQYHPVLPTLYIASILVNLIVAFLMLSKSRLFVGWLLFMMGMDICIWVGRLIVLSRRRLLDDGPMGAGEIFGNLMAIIVPFATAAAYVLRSRRVRNTFVR